MTEPPTSRTDAWNSLNEEKSPLVAFERPTSPVAVVAESLELRASTSGKLREVELMSWKCVIMTARRDCDLTDFHQRITEYI